MTEPRPISVIETDALVVGAGPAGLMAAEQLAKAGFSVRIAEQMPSAGRKFLMAGKSGLNLTKSEEMPVFLKAYGAGADWLAPMLDAFGPEEVQAWARGLGQPIFTGSTGRVFPEAMKASPLLRAWMARLGALGVRLETRWRCLGWHPDGVLFETPDGPVAVRADAVVLALGGASWRRLGSDGAWTRWVSAECAPFAPANVGLTVRWSEHMQRHFGTPIKGVALRAGDLVSRGEVVVSARGFEGGGIYPLAPALRAGADMTLDLCPDLSVEALAGRLSKVPAKASVAVRLRKGAGVPPVKQALAQEWARPLPKEAGALARVLKGLIVPHAGLRPMDEAISVAGGLARSALNARLMLRDRPGVFACGEMLDWEAPTGGYLLSACFATGRWAGLGAVDWLREAQAAARM